MLRGANVILGVGGSIAAFKAIELLRLLTVDEGAKVTKLSVNLSAYVDRGKNTVVIKDGKTELLNKTFGNNHSQSWNDLDATVQHKFSIKVTTWDGFNFSEEKTVEPCVKKAPPKPEQPKPEQPKPEQPKPEQPKPEEPKPPVETTPEAPSSSVTPPAPAPPPGHTPSGEEEWPVLVGSSPPAPWPCRSVGWQPSPTCRPAPRSTPRPSSRARSRPRWPSRWCPRSPR